LVYSDMNWLRGIILSAPNGANILNIKLAETQLQFNVNAFIKKFVELINGKRTLLDIYEEGCSVLRVSRSRFIREIRGFIDLMARHYILLLCHRMR